MISKNETLHLFRLGILGVGTEMKENDGQAEFSSIYQPLVHKVCEVIRTSMAMMRDVTDESIKVTSFSFE